MSGPRSRESRPVLRLRDGSALPAHLAAVHATLMRVPEAMHAQASRAAAKALLFRLPAMQATYPDGRRFEIRAGGAMSAQILVHGAYEPAESAVTSSLLREGDFAVDIGANFGWYSLLMGAAVGPGGLIWAVEPVPRC